MDSNSIIAITGIIVPTATVLFQWGAMGQKLDDIVSRLGKIEDNHLSHIEPDIANIRERLARMEGATSFTIDAKQ